MNTAPALRTKSYQFSDAEMGVLLTKAAEKIEAVAKDQRDQKEAMARLQEDQSKQMSVMTGIIQKAEKIDRDKQHGGEFPHTGHMQLKSITETESFEHFRQRRMDRSERYALDMSVKALLSDNGDPDTANGLYPGPRERLPGLHGFAMRPLRLLDVLTVTPQTAGVFEYVRIGATGGADVQEGDGEEKAKIDFDGTLVTGRVATIAVHTTCSSQVLDDDAQLQAELSRIMSHSVLAKVEEQLIVGSGTGMHVEGLYTAATAITTLQNEVPDRIGAAIVEMESEGHAPNVILMNPTDWFAISILKDSEGRYLYGNPAAPAPPMLWNRPVLTSSTVPVGHVLVGDTAQCQVRDRMQPTIFLSRDHLDYRTRNLVLILVEARVGLAIFNAQSFRKVSLAAQT